MRRSDSLIKIEICIVVNLYISLQPQSYSAPMKITRSELDYYRSKVCPGITSIYWEAGDLDPTVLVNLPNLRKLYCYRGKLTTLAGIEHCPLLEEIDCWDNQLVSLKGIEHCPKLRKLYCYINKIESLAGIEHCPLLEDLDCRSNQITSLKQLEYCPLLRKLCCYRNLLTSLVALNTCKLLQSLLCFWNQITSLDGIEECTQLQTLWCHYNRLTSIGEVKCFTQLQDFWCHGNQITSLIGIEYCIQLRELSCYENRLVSLEPLVYLRNLHELRYSDNPLDIQTIQVQRFLARFDRPIINRCRTDKSIYANTQNVHDIHIQKTVCESVQRLLQDPKPEFSIDTIINSSLSPHTIELLVGYCSDGYVHSAHLLTYFELLSYVWARIERSEHRTELFKILEEQVTDSECKCFTGRINRTLSVLVGFCPDIVITISDNSRIGAIIIAIKQRLNPYDPIVHREVASRELLEAGYANDEIEPWLGAISEPWGKA